MTLPAFIRETFRDATGQPSALLATAFGVNAGIIAAPWMLWIFKVETPIALYIAMVAFGGALLGIDMSLSRAKLTADNPAPAPAVGTVNTDSIIVNTAEPQ